MVFGLRSATEAGAATTLSHRARGTVTVEPRPVGVKHTCDGKRAVIVADI